MQSVVTKGSLWLPLVVSIAITVGGCAGTMDETTQQEMAQLRRDVNALNLAVHRGRGESDTSLNQIDRRSREQAAENARQTAAMNTRLESLSAEVNRLSARVDELSRRLDSQSRRVGREQWAEPPSHSGAHALSLGWVEIIERAGSRGKLQGRLLGLHQGQLHACRRRVPGVRAAVSGLAPCGQRAVLDRGVLLQHRSRRRRGGPGREIARGAGAVGTGIPQGLRELSRGRQVPTALYKEALALVELKQMKVAQARLQYLVDNFPQSEEAPLARERLKSLGE